MKRILIYIVVLAMSLLVPEYKTDVGKLIPVELLYLYRDEEIIVLETDCGNWGQGETVEEAIINMKESAAGEIFLDTADYLLIDENAEDLLDEMDARLKGSVWVCKAEKGLDLAEAAQYLSVHKPEMNLKEADKEQLTEELTEEDGRISFLQKSEFYA